MALLYPLSPKLEGVRPDGVGGFFWASAIASQAAWYRMDNGPTANNGKKAAN